MKLPFCTVDVFFVPLRNRSELGRVSMDHASGRRETR
jgi:hypothetical protein